MTKWEAEDFETSSATAGGQVVAGDQRPSPAAANLIAYATQAIGVLAKHAHPYNHEYTLMIRLTKAIGEFERARADVDGDLLEATRELLATHPAAYREPNKIDNRTDAAVRIARAALAKVEA